MDMADDLLKCAKWVYISINDMDHCGMLGVECLFKHLFFSKVVLLPLFSI